MCRKLNSLDLSKFDTSKVTDGSDVEMTDGGKIPFTFGRENTSQTLMPGDTVTINFKVSLQDISEPAYYLVSLTDTKGVFASNTYFSDGTNSYRADNKAIAPSNTFKLL